MINLIAWVKPKFRDLYTEIGNGWQYYTIILVKQDICEIYNGYHKSTLFVKKEHLNY